MAANFSRAAAFFDGGVPDAPLGFVDDPPQAQGIGGIFQDAEVSQHILDLLPLKEADPADDLVRNPPADECLLDGVGLGVHPV